MKAKLGSWIACLFLLAGTEGARGQTQPPQQQQPDSQTQPPAAQTQSPPLPAAAPDRDTGGDAWSIEPIYWYAKSPPALRLGAQASGQTTSGSLDFPAGGKYVYGGVVTVPTPKENSLQFSYFRAQGHGDTTAATDLLLFLNSFPSGDALVTSYRLQDLKVSWNYLSYPSPSKGAKFRFKTLWEFQYVSISPSISAPADVNAVNTTATKHILLPTLGVGIEYHLSRHLRVQAKASGMGLPHRSDIGDAEGAAVFRMGVLEAFAGGKVFHFKTSPKGDQFLTETLWGPYFGLRWICK